MNIIIVLFPLAFAQAARDKPVSGAEKREFLKLVSELPTRGEFFTDEAIAQAAPHIHVLFALSEKDVKEEAIYPLLALTRGLVDRKKSQQYALAHFSEIAHPRIKLLWAAALFRADAESPEILAFLRRALDSTEEARKLSGSLGPGFEEFKENVLMAHEASRQARVDLVTRHAVDVFPEYGRGLDYTNECMVFGPGPCLYAVRGADQQGELVAYDVAEGKIRRLAVPQPKGFRAELDSASYVDDPVLSINSDSDLFVRWTIGGNGDHGIAVLQKESDSFIVERVKLYLASCFVLADRDGHWYLIQGAPNFTVYKVDEELDLTRLGNFAGRGHHSIRILDARFIAPGVLHLFWGDVLSEGNHLRMRSVDFHVKDRMWLHDRELYRLDRFVSSANESTLLQLEDGSLHYFWRIQEGLGQDEATGLYYQPEAASAPIRVTAGHEYRAVAAGDRIVVAFTAPESPEKVFFRVISRGTLGPISEITIASGREHNLTSKYISLYSESDRIWFVDTLAPNALYELTLRDGKGQR